MIMEVETEHNCMPGFQKKDLMRALMLAHELKLDGYESQLGKPLHDPDWLLHCAGYPVGNRLSATYKARPAKTPLNAGDENDAIQWLAAADAADMHTLRTKCHAIVLKFISSDMDPEKEECGRTEAQENLDPGMLYDLARFALEVNGVNGICSCHKKLSNGERICYPCALAVVGRPQCAAGPSR